MQKLLLLLLLTLSFFSTQSFAASCPDGSEPAKTLSSDGSYYVYKCLNDKEKGSPAVIGTHRFTEESFIEYKKNVEVSFGIDVKNWISLTDGIYDFDNIPIRYIGENKKCGDSKSGSDPFIFIHGKNITIKNMNITKSSPDGIDISQNSKIKFENLNINHSCDEGITLRGGSEVVILDSKIVNHDNKGIMFDYNNRATIKNTEFIIEQTFSLNNFGLLINLDNVIIRRHPLADYGRLITGDNCGDIEINIKKTKFYGIQKFDGTKKCSNIKINNN